MSDSNDSTEDFAALFEASIKAKRFKEGQTLEGRIVSIGPEVAFVDVGGKGEATIDVDELKDEDGAIEVSVGDRVQAVVVSVSGGLQLSRRLARGAASNRQLEDAFRAGLPVEGRVEGEIKGGYEVRVSRQRAFCPYSQMDLHRSEPAAHIGKVYAFRITEYKDGGRSLVVSRRALLEEEQRAKAAEVRKAIVPGAVVTGRVVSVRDFGAFVDLGGGVQGLLHVSEMGWSRVMSPAAVVEAGQAITVKVLRVDPMKHGGRGPVAENDDSQKIALGLKQLLEDPWSRVSEKYAVGQVLGGRVTRLADFGAFVELEPGVEALAHASTFAPSGKSKGWADQVPVGASLPFEILSVEVDKKRIGVALVPEGTSRARAVATAAESAHGSEASDAAPTAPTEAFGSLADKLRGALKPK